jgi:hypothetical protein
MIPPSLEHRQRSFRLPMALGQLLVLLPLVAVPPFSQRVCSAADAAFSRLLAF